MIIKTEKDMSSHGITVHCRINGDEYIGLGNEMLERVVDSVISELTKRYIEENKAEIISNINIGYIANAITMNVAESFSSNIERLIKHE